MECSKDGKQDHNVKVPGEFAERLAAALDAHRLEALSENVEHVLALLLGNLHKGGIGRVGFYDKIDELAYEGED